MTRKSCTGCSCGTRPSDGTDEGPSEEDIAAFSDVTRPCPNCKADIYDDVVVCWKCGHMLSEAPGSKSPPVWVVVVSILLLAAIVVFWLR
jgi:hypothetical protein